MLSISAPCGLIWAYDILIKIFLANIFRSGLFLTPFLNKLQLSDKESAGFGKIVRVQLIRSAVTVFFSIVHPAIQTESKSDKDDISLLQKEPPV